jgi:hypothetical protein
MPPKQISQVLIVTWGDGRVTNHRRSNWADFVDMRQKYDDNPKVRETEVQYDL